jgi:hypothetical protein
VRKPAKKAEKKAEKKGAKKEQNISSPYWIKGFRWKKLSSG